MHTFRRDLDQILHMVIKNKKNPSKSKWVCIFILLSVVYYSVLEGPGKEPLGSQY